MNSLSNIGVDVKLFCLEDLNHLEPSSNVSDPIFYGQLNFNCNFETNNIIGLLRREICIYRTLIPLLRSLESTDIIFSRNPLFSVSTSIALKKTRKCKIAFEYQSIEPQEMWSSRHYLLAIFDLMFGKARRKNVDAIVGVTDEITMYQLARSGNLSKPHITIGNGFDVASVPPRQPPAYTGDDLHLLCVANVSRWHGLDRLLRGLAAYSGTPKVTLHIAGDGAELPHLQQLTEELGIGDRVIFHGFTTGKALDDLFDQCHVAVGSLGIHRIGLKEASILKAREYCARGIPFIYGTADPDFPADFPYILHLPADESPIDIKQVLAFAQEVCADPDHPQKMRRYAEEHLDWSVKMKKLKGFLEALVGENEGENVPEVSDLPLAAKELKTLGGTAPSSATQGDAASRVPEK